MRLVGDSSSEKKTKRTSFYFLCVVILRCNGGINVIYCFYSSMQGTMREGYEMMVYWLVLHIPGNMWGVAVMNFGDAVLLIL